MGGLVANYQYVTSTIAVQNFLQNGILHFVFKVSRSLEIVLNLEFTQTKDFYERGLALKKGLYHYISSI